MVKRKNVLKVENCGDIQMNPGPSINQHITEPVSGSTECNPSWSVSCSAEISGPSVGDVGSLAKLPLDILQDVPMFQTSELSNSPVFDSESFDMHPCQGLYRLTPEERPVEEHTATVLQVCTLYNASQCSTVHSNLSCPSSMFGDAMDGMLSGCAGAVAGVVDWHARVSCAGVGIGDVPGAFGVGVGVVRSVHWGSRGTSLRSDGFTVTSGGSGVLSGHGVHVGLARPWAMTTLTVGT
ncbi:hypothetical protein Q7C36_004019 [Tachysurus vachellii]|uniref:Uncharacterized protein n=1 Tax=Tachysurus vachellii TaxID=175792 RepID=A0AA88NVR2_TACVA|nr:hypothetical protein Q7C36_004019 [Tachysurus vachellii]